MNKAFDEKEEGVVIKESGSVYAPGKRIASWIKIKPDVSVQETKFSSSKFYQFHFQYIDGLVSDFDLLVIGGYYNPSKKFIYKYLVGVQKKTSSSTLSYSNSCRDDKH